MEPIIRNTTAYCPSCGERPILVIPLKIGEIIQCCFCKSDLEVLKLDPIILDWPLRSDSSYDHQDYTHDLDDWRAA
jgi:hypothetical protein